nr:hypothetical protein [Tanacetum cinerariifolium]
SGTLPGNTITNPKEDLKGITTRSRTAYLGPTIPTTSSSSPVVERETEATKDTVHPANNGSTKDVQPSVILTESIILNSEPVVSPIIEPVASPINAPRPTQRPSIPYPSRLHDQMLYFDADPRVPLILEKSFLKTERALIDVFEGELTLQYSQEVLGFSDLIVSGNPTPYYDPIVSTTSSTLTLFESSDFFLEEVDTFLALEDDPTSLEVDQSYIVTEGDILLLEAFLNDDPSLPPPNQGNYLPEVHKELKICEAKSDKSLIDEPPEVELKDLPLHLEYAFLEGDNKLPVIIAKDLSVEEKTALITTGRALIDVHMGVNSSYQKQSHHLQFGSKYSANYNQMTANKIDVIDLACEEYSQKVLGFSDVTTSGNPTPHDDPIVSTMSPNLTPFGDSDFLLFEEADNFLGLEDDPNSLKINPFYYDAERDILLLEAILNSEPLPPLPNHE